MGGGGASLTAVLSRQDILRLVEQDPPLVTGYRDLDAQLQPNGFDLTVREVGMVQTAGQIAASNARRMVSALAPLTFDAFDFVQLIPGPYIVTYNEVVNRPEDLMALGRPRSSLLRSGVTVHGAVWDAGYSGRSQSLLVVHNPLGFRLQRNAAVLQLVFLLLTGKTGGYSGAYQGENLD